MKKVSFLDIIDIDLTDKQVEALEGLKEQFEKFSGKLKLTKLLDRKAIIHALQEKKPELWRKMSELGLIEQTEARPVFRMNTPRRER